MYIGETGRCLDIRIAEHRRAVYHLDKKNAMAVHIAEHMDHKILWEESTIKEYESNWLKRRIKEAIWIKRTVNALNTDPGININPTWNTMLLKRTDKKESGCQDSEIIDEIPSRENTGSGAMTAPSLDTQ